MRSYWLNAPRTSQLAALLLFVGAITAAPASAVTILNDTFDAPDYFSFSFNGSNGSGGGNADDFSFESFSEEFSGGNPGGHLLIEHFHEVDRDPGTGEPINGDGTVFLQSVFSEQSMAYNPLAQGAIATITFSIDVNLGATGAEGGVFDEALFTIDNGSQGNLAGFTSIASLGSGWHTVTSSVLTNTDFFLIDFAGPADLEFGFGFSSFGDVFAGDEQLDLLVDNFKVDITVPEPSGLLAVAGLALVGLCRGGRRQV